VRVVSVPVLMISPAASGGASGCVESRRARWPKRGERASQHDLAEAAVDDRVTLSQDHFHPGQPRLQIGQPVDRHRAAEDQAAMQAIERNGVLEARFPARPVALDDLHRMSDPFDRREQVGVARGAGRAAQLEADLGLDAGLTQTLQSHCGPIVVDSIKVRSYTVPQIGS
jgi:hypothetical protein